MDGLIERLTRLEDEAAIRQLAVRYAMAVDRRDLDDWVSLFVEDVDCGRRGRGREALRDFIGAAVSTFYRSVHMVGGHVIDRISGDEAEGRVYCRAEHEVDDRWIVQAVCYFDQYAKRDGEWLFVSRKEAFFYSCDVIERPQDARFARWPGPPPGRPPAMLPDGFPNWRAYWSDRGTEPPSHALIAPS
nr:nuclear transport factor 2 family protein [uncultured Brevundimonas sp.]